MGATPITGSAPEQKRQWLPELTAGRMLGAFGAHQPVVGRTLATHDRRDGDEGHQRSKVFITNPWVPTSPGW